jgi:MFS family permease
MAKVHTTFHDEAFACTLPCVFGMCFAITLIDGFDTGAIGFIAPSLLSEWHLQRVALGPVLSAALLGLACGAVFAGPISDRFGRRLPIDWVGPSNRPGRIVVGICAGFIAVDGPTISHRNWVRRRTTECSDNNERI